MTCLSTALRPQQLSLSPEPDKKDSSVPAEPAYKLRALHFLQGRTVSSAAIGDTPMSTAEALASARASHAKMASDRFSSQQLASPRAATLSAAWQPVGPNQIASLAYGKVTGRITSIAIDPGDPTGNTVYLGTTGGGVWKSTNAAGAAAPVSFRPLTDTLPIFSANAGTSAVPSISIGALAVQPGAGQTAVILAGTGDPNDAADSYYGSGILRSRDGGSTWTLAQGSRDGVAGNHSFLGLGSAGFAWSTTTTGLVVAAMSQSAEGLLVNAPDTTNSVMGLYYSTDAGTTWQMATILDGSQVVQTPLPSGGNSGGNAATAVVWNPLRQMFFAAIRFHGIYQSPDGATWTRLTHQPGTGLTLAACPSIGSMPGSPNCPLFRSALAVQPISGDTYALTVDRDNLDQGLWVDICSPSGSACTNSITFGTQVPSSPLQQGSGSTVILQGDYDLSLAATPSFAGDTIETVLYVGTIDLYRCAFQNGSASGCLLRNTTNALNGCVATSQVAPAQHTLAILALSQPLLYMGNDGGLWRSTDGVAQSGTACSADDATHFQNLNGSLGSLAESVSLAAHPTDPETLLVGVGANGTALTSSASSLLPWPQLAAGEGGQVAIDQAAPQNLYISDGAGVSISHCALGASCAATDFSGRPTLGPAQVASDASLVDAPFLLDPASSTVILIGTCRVYRGPADDGTVWSTANALSKPFGGPANTTCSATTNPLVRSLAAGGPLSSASATQNAGSTVLYAGLAGSLDGGGTLGGHLFVTQAGATAGPATAWTDTAGANVTNVSNGGHFNPGQFDLSSVVIDSHDATGKTVYATVMGFAGNGSNAAHLYRSLNAGSTWTNISSNLPNSPANSVVIDPNDANTLYIALDTGVYVTTSVATCAMANCWTVFGTGLPNSPVIDLVASAEVPVPDGRTGVLRAATYGRGVWQLALLTATSPVAVPAITVSPTSLIFSVQAVATESASQAVTVSNTGNAPLTLSSITTTGDFTESDTCTAVGANILAAGGACTVQVSFLPSASGSRTGVLTVFGNAPGGQAIVGLSGSGTPPAAIILNPITIAFPDTVVGVASARINITISNTGGVAAALQTPIISGAEFTLSANTCGTSLASQTGCTVSVVFQPTASGVRNGTFSITDDAGTQTASLLGHGTFPATDGLSPLSLSFGPQVINTTSPAQIVTLTNTGDAALTLIAAQIASGDFTVVNACGNSLNGHASCTLSVAYVPKNVGAESGLLTLNDQFRSQTVALNGTGLAPAGVSLAPFSGLAFAATAVGVTTASQTVTLNNSGGVALAIQGFALTGDFLIVGGSNTCTVLLAPAASCSLQVAFAPSANGEQSGSLTVSDSTASSPQSLPLTGFGVDFTLVANGATTVTTASGTSAVFPLLLSSASGTPGNASFTCLGAPVNAACNVTPQDPMLGAATTVSVTVATGIAGSTVASRVPQHPSLFGLLSLAGLLPLGFSELVRRARRDEKRIARSPGWLPRALLLALLLGGLSGCGTGREIPDAAGTTPTAPPENPTPSGSYSIAISATSAGLTRTVNVTLIVQ